MHLHIYLAGVELRESRTARIKNLLVTIVRPRAGHN